MVVAPSLEGSAGADAAKPRQRWSTNEADAAFEGLHKMNS